MFPTIIGPDTHMILGLGNHACVTHATPNCPCGFRVLRRRKCHKLRRILVKSR